LIDGRAKPYGIPSWCWGDPGITLCLLAASRAIGWTAVEADCLAMARRVAALDPASTGLADASLCHGFAGGAHMLNRLFQATEDEQFRVAAQTWIAHLLAVRNDTGLAGWWFNRDDGGIVRRVRSAGLLTGASGVGLVLTAATCGIPPWWDRVMVLGDAMESVASAC